MGRFTENTIFVFCFRSVAVFKMWVGDYRKEQWIFGSTSLVLYIVSLIAQPLKSYLNVLENKTTKLK